MRRGTPGAIQFGQDLFDIRKMKNLTMRDVSEVLGTVPAHVSQAEKGQRIRDRINIIGGSDDYS